MKTPLRDFDQSYTGYRDKIITRIKYVMDIQDKPQNVLASECGISTSSLSKLLKKGSKTGFSLEALYKICSALSVDPAQLLSFEDNALDNIGAMNRRLLEISNNDSQFRDSLLFDPTRPAFLGIVNDPNDKNDFYYMYCKRTISRERKGFLKGKLRLIPSETLPIYCKARLELDIGQKDRDGNPIIKVYEGEAVISLPMGVVYVILSSTRFAEINLLVFKHMFLNTKELTCRMCSVLTVSAGTNRRPVSEKAIISREELFDNDLDALEGQLYMNTSMIRVDSKIFDKFAGIKRNLEGEIEYEEIESDDITVGTVKIDSIMRKNLRSLETIMNPPVSYYEIDESQISASDAFTGDEKTYIINLLRRLSNNPRYIKVSSHCDEILYMYLQDLVRKRAEQENENNSL